MTWASEWKYCEATGPIPAGITAVRTVPWDGFAESVKKSDPLWVRGMVESLWKGEAWILKGAFSRGFMHALREATVDWTRARPPAFHKMVEGTPDFHRVIDFETGRKYSIRGCKHSAYFYRWNDDPLGIWPAITERWRIAKAVMGLAPTEYETFTPKDGVVDRIQVVRYPPAIGYLEPHVDAWQHQRCFFSAYMSKRGVDYQGGGFYFVDIDDEPMFVEDKIDVGDVCLGHANLMHGVAPCDRHKVPDWKKDDGRWFLSLYSNASDMVPQRETAKPVRVPMGAECYPAEVL